MKRSFSEGDRLEYARTTKAQHPANEIHHTVEHGPIALGCDGFGWVRDENNQLIKMPHKGNIVIEHNVEFGSYCSVDRAVEGSTFIGEGTKIGHRVHIAHGAKIGKHCLLVDHVGIGGSAEIGDYSYIGFGAHIKNKVTVGKNCIIGMGAVVIKDVPDGEVWAGNPAKFIKKNV